MGEFEADLTDYELDHDDRWDWKYIRNFGQTNPFRNNLPANQYRELGNSSNQHCMLEECSRTIKIKQCKIKCMDRTEM